MIKDKYTHKQFLKRVPDFVPLFIGDKIKPCPAEDDDLISIVDWFKCTWPEHKLSIMHPTNETMASHAGYYRQRKAKGLLDGAHDIIIFLPAGRFHYGTFELKKADHTSKITEQQIQVAVTNIKNGGFSCFAFGYHQMKLAISAFMRLRNSHFE